MDLMRVLRSYCNCGAIADNSLDRNISTTSCNIRRIAETLLPITIDLIIGLVKIPWLIVM